MKMKIKNGNMPAMPFVDPGFGQYQPEVVSGLTKREMFAMNAPSDIPSWFSDGFKANLNHIKKPELTDHQEKMMHEYNNDNYGLSEDDFKIGSDASSLMRAYSTNCHNEHLRQLYFSWKVFHADTLLAELDK